MYTWTQRDKDIISWNPLSMYYTHQFELTWLPVWTVMTPLYSIDWGLLHKTITILTKKPLWLQALGTALSMLASVPLGELFFFHMILIRKVSDFSTCHYFCPILGGLVQECNLWTWLLCCTAICRASQLMNMLWPWGLRVIHLDLLSMMISRAWHLLQWVLHQLLLVGARLHGTTKVHGALPLVFSLTR